MPELLPRIQGLRQDIICSRTFSLAQRGDTPVSGFWDQVDFYDQMGGREVEDGMRNLLTQPDRNPLLNLAGMRQKDDLRNLWFVSAPLIPAAAGEVYLFVTTPLVVAELKSISLAFQASHSQLSQAASYGITYNFNQTIAVSVNVASQAGRAYAWGSGLSFGAGYFAPDFGNTPLGSPCDFLW